MAKSNKLAKVMPSTSKIETFITTKDPKTGTETYTLSDVFIESVKVNAGTVGKIFQSFEEKQAELSALAINIHLAYEEWKRVTGDKSLPKWVHTYFDAKVPEAYGQVGSKERKLCNESHIFRGIEAFIKRAKKTLKLKADEQEHKLALKAAGINEENTKAVEEFDKKQRAKAAKSDIEEFAVCIAGFIDPGVTVETITDLLEYMGKVTKKGELSATGKAMLEAAKNEVLKAHAKTA